MMRGLQLRSRANYCLTLARTSLNSVANIPPGLLEAVPQLIDDIGRCRCPAVEPLASVEPSVAELLDERVERVLRVHGAQVSLQVESSIRACH